MRLKFWDHCEDNKHLITITAYGEVEKVTRHRLVFRGWYPDDPRCRDEDTKRWSVIRSAIRKIKRLK